MTRCEVLERRNRRHHFPGTQQWNKGASLDRIGMRLALMEMDEN